jgi:hypothetical protein
VTAAHAAADSDIVTGKPAVFDNGNETDVVGENVDVVDGRNDERESAWSAE